MANYGTPFILSAKVRKINIHFFKNKIKKYGYNGAKNQKKV